MFPRGVLFLESDLESNLELLRNLEKNQISFEALRSDMEKIVKVGLEKDFVNDSII